VLLLTEELGQQVLTADGDSLGRAVELVVPTGDATPAVIRLGIGRGRRVRSWVSWSDVATFERSGVTLRPGALVTDAGAVTIRDQDELWLHRDVLDAQILDADGAQVVRVGDIVLARAGDVLRVVAVEIGTGPVLRRLGFHRWGSRRPSHAITWRDLHLASGHGLAVQLAAKAPRLRTLEPSELAAMIADITTQSAIEVLDAVGPTEAAEALSVLHSDASARLVQALPEPLAAAVVEHMAADDAAAMLRSVPSEHLDRLLVQVGSVRARALRQLLAARPDTAGGLMSTDVRTARPGDSLEEIRARMAADPPPVDGLATVFVVDDDGRPIGVIDIVALITGRAVRGEVSPIPVDMPVDEVIDEFAGRDDLALPVVDGDGRLVGAIAVDDVLGELLAERLPGRHRFRDHLGRLGGPRSRRRTPRRP